MSEEDRTKPDISTEKDYGEKPASAEIKTKIPKCPSLPSSNKFYKYSVQHGNNSRLILQTFRMRPWWRTVTKFDENDWNLYWIPYIKKCHFDMLKTKTEKHQKVSINHFEHGAGALTSKKGMYLSLAKYLDNNKIEIKKIIPETYILTANKSDKELEQFTYSFNQHTITCMKCNKKFESEDGNICKCEEPIKSKNIWIIKPPGANRGTNIKLFDNYDKLLSKVNKIKESESDEESKTSSLSSSSSSDKKDKKPKQWVVQKYMENPLLYKGRKFDIRVFVLLRVNPQTKSSLDCFIYKDYYLRTSSTKYVLGDINNKMVHLTNDAIQRQSSDFGKFEISNKVTRIQYKKYLQSKYGDEEGSKYSDSFHTQILNIINVTISSVESTINPNNYKYCFQMFGYDFMIDTDMNVKLIEINTNPSLDYDPTEVPFKQYMFPRMLEELFELTIDQYFPCPEGKVLNNESVKWKECAELSDTPDNGENRWEYLFTVNEKIKKGVI